MRALVTGGAGFIGSHLVDRLIERGDEVCVLDNLSTGRLENISHWLGHPRFKFVKESILNRKIVTELAADSQVVYHLAAAVGVSYIVNDPLRAIVTNVQGTENVLAAAYRFRAKVVIASSSEVYGKNTTGPLREDDDRVLGPTTINRWSYSSSKAIDEHFGFAYAERELPVVMLRFFNSYGPRIHANGYGTVVARFVKQALNGQPITVHGDGSQTRCFTFVDDTVAGVILAAITPGAEGRVFNIGNTSETSVLRLAQLVRSMTNTSSEITLMPYRDYYGQSYEDTPRRVPDITRASTILGFRPTVSLEDGLRQTVAWCRQHGFVPAEAARESAIAP